MPLRRGRAGRPGLLGTIARTAVVAGTATATSNAVNNRAARKRSAEQQTAAPPPAAAAPPPPAYAAPPPVYAAPPPPAAPVDLVGKLKELSDLHSAGALSDAEFAAAKAQLLG
ncbi:MULTISPECIES: SHOCT domain-containing protein [Nocardia]|uniref:SHOCT domain-containing protein n=1 Tax=Nocardia TaxID=1817 RepID=UPI0029307CBC|nr:SHOCT domain-containing protein [Nocardia canadensis]